MSSTPSSVTLRTVSHSFSAVGANVSADSEPSSKLVVLSSVFNKPASTCLYSTSPIVNSSPLLISPISVITPSAAVAVTEPLVTVTASPVVGVTLVTTVPPSSSLPSSATARVTVPVFNVEPSSVASTVNDEPSVET